MLASDDQRPLSRRPLARRAGSRGNRPDRSVADDCGDSADPPGGIDRLLISHAHEDHLSGVFRYPGDADSRARGRLGGRPVPARADGRLRLARGHRAAVGEGSRRTLSLRRAAGRGRLSRRRRLRSRRRDPARHPPAGSHQRSLRVPASNPAASLFLADIDLSGFGPYYGDRSSSLDAFEETLRRCRDLDARSLRHVPSQGRRRAAGPRSWRCSTTTQPSSAAAKSACATGSSSRARSTTSSRHRFIYRPHVTLLFVEGVERRSAELHLERLVARGEVKRSNPAAIGAFDRRAAGVGSARTRAPPEVALVAGSARASRQCRFCPPPAARACSPCAGLDSARTSVQLESSEASSHFAHVDRHLVGAGNVTAPWTQSSRIPSAARG